MLKLGPAAMWQNLLLVSLIGGIVAMDTTAAWQVMISHPLVACTFLGFLWGNLPLGLTVGLLMELPWLLEFPIGGAKFSEGNVGSLVASATSLQLVRINGREEAVLFFSIILGILVSVLGGQLVVKMREYNRRLIYKADAFAEEGDLQRVSHLNIMGVFHSFILGGVLAGIFFYVGFYSLAKIIELIPPSWDRAFILSKGALLGVGCGGMMVLFLRRKNLWALSCGLMLGALILLF